MCHISTMPKMMSAVNPTLSPNTTTLVMRSTVRRLKLSATTPASIPKMTAGTVRATSIIPRSAADPPRCRMNRGLANWSIHRAKAWVICPSQRKVKSLYCREANVPPISPPSEAPAARRRQLRRLPFVPRRGLVCHRRGPAAKPVPVAIDGWLDALQRRVVSSGSSLHRLTPAVLVQLPYAGHEEYCVDGEDYQQNGQTAHGPLHAYHVGHNPSEDYAKAGQSELHHH